VDSINPEDVGNTTESSPTVSLTLIGETVIPISLEDVGNIAGFSPILSLMLIGETVISITLTELGIVPRSWPTLSLALTGGPMISINLEDVGNTAESSILSLMLIEEKVISIKPEGVGAAHIAANGTWRSLNLPDFCPIVSLTLIGDTVISINPEDVGATAPCSIGETAGKGVISANTYDRNTRGGWDLPHRLISGTNSYPVTSKYRVSAAGQCFLDLGSCSRLEGAHSNSVVHRRKTNTNVSDHLE